MSLVNKIGLSEKQLAIVNRIIMAINYAIPVLLIILTAIQLTGNNFGDSFFGWTLGLTICLFLFIAIADKHKISLILVYYLTLVLLLHFFETYELAITTMPFFAILLSMSIFNQIFVVGAIILVLLAVGNLIDINQAKKKQVESKSDHRISLSADQSEFVLKMRMTFEKQKFSTTLIFLGIGILIAVLSGSVGLDWKYQYFVPILLILPFAIILLMELSNRQSQFKFNMDTFKRTGILQSLVVVAVLFLSYAIFAFVVWGQFDADTQAVLTFKSWAIMSTGFAVAVGFVVHLIMSFRKTYDPSIGFGLSEAFSTGTPSHEMFATGMKQIKTETDMIREIDWSLVIGFWVLFLLELMFFLSFNSALYGTGFADVESDIVDYLLVAGTGLLIGYLIITYFRELPKVSLIIGIPFIAGIITNCFIEFTLLWIFLVSALSPVILTIIGLAEVSASPKASSEKRRASAKISANSDLKIIKGKKGKAIGKTNKPRKR